MDDQVEDVMAFLFELLVSQPNSFVVKVEGFCEYLAFVGDLFVVEEGFLCLL